MVLNIAERVLVAEMVRMGGGVSVKKRLVDSKRTT